LLAAANEKLMTAENAQMTQHPVTDNAVVLGALGVLAYAASMMTHEALGHGVYCLAAGGWEFDDWAPELTALITDGETEP
jgi:hypothetical protein